MHVTMGLVEVHETSGKIWLFNLNHYFQNFNRCIMWLHLSKMRVVICQKKNLHCVPSFEPLTFITVYEGRCFGHVICNTLLRTYISSHFLRWWPMSDLVHWPTEMIDIDHHTLTGPSGLLYLQAQLIEFVANAWQVLPTLVTFYQPHWVCT
jgi:hypothetical protein